MAFPKHINKFIKIIFSLLIIFGLISIFENNNSNAANTNINITSVSKLAKIKSENTLIYPKIENLKQSYPADSNLLNKVYYVKQQAKVGRVNYYAIKSSSSANKIIGWVKSNDLITYEHKTIDKKTKNFYIKGTGTAYKKIWGGSSEVIIKNLSTYKFSTFKVNLTEKVGKNTWYRGTLNGQVVWIHSSNVVSKLTKSDTSRLGQLKENAIIYNKLSTGAKIIPNSNYLNRVYYIKQQAKFGNETYYLISTKASKKDGVIGWVKSTEITTYELKTVDSKTKTFYLNGMGTAYSKAWGGSNDVVFKNLSSYKFSTFKVNLTEKVGKNTWYRGTLDGKNVWVHSSYVVSNLTKSDTSRLGQLKENAIIYNKLSTGAKIISNSSYLNSVFYIKQQAKFGNETYYLISTKASKKDGVIGWVNSTQLTTYTHSTVDSQFKLFYIKGAGVAYNKPWGGSKDIVYKDLSELKGEDFYVNMTNKVDNNTWYRGTLNGKTVWIHKNNVVQSFVKKTKYNISFSKALSLQMVRNPQTDKYRNSAAYVDNKYIKDIYGQTTGTTTNLRSSAKLIDSNIVMNVEKGTKFEVLDTNVTGDKSNGSIKWFKIKYKNKTLYVHSSVAKIYGTTTADVKVHSSASSSSHSYGVIKKGEKVTITNIGQGWSTISYNTWRNAKKSDVSYYLNPENFLTNSVQKFQFLNLSSSSGVSATKLNNYLKDKGIFKGKGQAFVDAGKKYGINELYLVAHAMLETGHGTSQLATGVTYKGKKVYNMYGIGAYDSCPITCGAKTAYEKGWTTPAKAIIGGAQFVSTSYIYGKNDQGIVQNTLYKMLWNPEAMVKLGYATHQYATDIAWAYKQVNTLYSLYNALNIKNVNLDIPVYK